MLKLSDENVLHFLKNEKFYGFFHGKILDVVIDLSLSLRACRTRPTPIPVENGCPSVC